jgi:CIC family chloride channel protein
MLANLPFRRTPSAAVEDEDLEAPLPADAEEARRLGLALLSLIALAVGVTTGLGAVAFRDLIGLIHNLMFLGEASVRYDANQFTPAAPWGPLVILVPVIGAVVVTFLVSTFAPEAKGHGVPRLGIQVNTI